MTGELNYDNTPGLEEGSANADNADNGQQQGQVLSYPNSPGMQPKADSFGAGDSDGTGDSDAALAAVDGDEQRTEPKNLSYPHSDISAPVEHPPQVESGLQYPKMTAGTDTAPDFEAMSEDELYTGLEKDLQTLTDITGTDYDAELDDVTPLKCDAYRQMCLLEKRELKELQPLLARSMQAAGMGAADVKMMKDFVAVASPDNALGMDIINLVIRHAYKARKGAQ